MTPTPPAPMRLKELQLFVIKHIKADAPIEQILKLEAELLKMRQRHKARPIIVGLAPEYLRLIRPMAHQHKSQHSSQHGSQAVPA